MEIGYLPAVLLALLESPLKVLPPRHKMPDLRSHPLTRTRGRLQVAADVIHSFIHSLRGCRKKPGYRTIQNDLTFVCEVLQRASAGETISQGSRE
jgi:hypothetical protein